jgi:hypothetical protein
MDAVTGIKEEEVSSSCIPLSIVESTGEGIAMKLEHRNVNLSQKKVRDGS